jgi:hypothetical protein
MSRFFLFKMKDLEIPPFFTVVTTSGCLEPPPIDADGEVVQVECDENSLAFWLLGIGKVWMSENPEEGWYAVELTPTPMAN